jgi:hypothetical protein
MQEPESQSSQDPHEEVELLREKLRRLEAEHAEVQQKLFDQYEWTREKTKAFSKELRTLRSISVEYKILDFLRRMYQQTTGLPMKTLEEDVEDLKVFLAAVPIKNDPNTDEWLRSLLSQTHTNFEITVVIGNSDPEPSQDIQDSPKIRIVRTEDEYSDAVRANIGLCYGSGDVWGVVNGGYWAYPATLRNVGQFFAQHSTCQVMLPEDIVLLDEGLIAPTERAQSEDFSGLWRHYSGRYGSLFFRPKGYKRIGRINYEAGDAWLFGTLLQLAWYFDVGRPNTLVVVNANPAPEDGARSRVELTNQFVRQHFYAWGFFNEYGKPVWYFPFRHTTHLSRGLRIRLERLFRLVRGYVFRLRRRMFSHGLVLHFPVSKDGRYDSPRSARLDFSQIDVCPLTGLLPDRLLFSLRPTGEKPVVNVFYSSETAVAVVSRRGLDSGVGTTPEDRTNHGEPILAALDSAITEVLAGEEIGDALWIGDPSLAPASSSSSGAVYYREKRLSDDYPCLISADLPALQASDVLAGRTTGTGFDLIHLAGIIQFCQRPRHLLRFLAFGLKFRRYMLVSSPNLDSAELSRFGPAWCHWERDRTRFIYGARSLRALLKHCGFEEKRIVTFSHPLWQSATRKNVANSPLYNVSDKSATGGTMAMPEGKGASKPTDLDGDFLVGLFARKL